MWKGEAQIQGRKLSSFIVVRRANNAWSASSTAKQENFVFDGDDEGTSQSLWHWGQTLISHQANMHADRRFLLGDLGTLSESDEQMLKDRDLTVMITGKIPYPPEARTGITPYGYVRVWDGTGPGTLDP